MYKQACFMYRGCQNFLKMFQKISEFFKVERQFKL